MFHSGEYVQPLIRKQEFHLPIVPGYTTGRLSSPYVATSGYNILENKVLIENTGITTVSVTLKSTDDYISGPRTQIGGTVSVVPKGQKYLPTFSVITGRYLEVSSPTGGSAGSIRMQIEGMVEWSIMAFDKAETIYAPSLTKHSRDTAPFPS